EIAEIDGLGIMSVLRSGLGACALDTGAQVVGHRRESAAGRCGLALVLDQRTHECGTHDHPISVRADLRGLLTVRDAEAHADVLRPGRTGALDQALRGG